MKKLTLIPLILIAALAFAQKDKDKETAKSDPWAGTWKFDAAQSKLHVPPAQEEIIIAEPTGADHMTVKYTIKGTAADGSAINESFDGRADGTPYPLIVDGKEVGKIIYRRDSVNQYSSESTALGGGKATGTIVLSNDEKTFTIKERIKDSTGEYDQIVVYRKQ
jgi:hypothetical protein